MSTPAFTCHRDLIRPLLTRVSKAVEKRNTIPILKNVLIQAESDGTLSITATDLDVKAVGSIDGVDVERPGATTVDAVTFLASISKMPEAPISVDATETDLTIKSGRARAKLKVLPAADFPDIMLADASHGFVMSAIDLTAMQDKCGFAISTEETRYYLNGIFVHEWEGKLVAVATDGHRLSQLTLDLPDGAKNMPGIIVPDRMVKHFGLFAEKADQAVKVELSDRFISFTVPNLSITSKLIDATYPDYRRVMAIDNPLKAEIPADDLEEALERLLIYADTKYRRVRFDFSAGLLRLSSQSDAGTAADELEVEADFDLSIGFNSRYLLDLIKTFKGTRIGIALDTPSSAPLITDAGDDRRLATIMPVALNGV